MRLRSLGSVLIVVSAVLVWPVGNGLAQSPAAPSPGSSLPPSIEETPALNFCHPRDQLGPRAYKRIAQPLIDALWSFYATGDDTSLTRVATPRGIDTLGEFDWRFRVVEGGDFQFREEPEIIDFNDWEEWCTSEKELVRLDLQPVLDIAPGGRTYDAARGRPKPIEAVRGRQQRAMNISLMRASRADDWLLDEVRAIEFRPRYIRPRPAIPCPGVSDPKRASDPFRMEPWCDAGGDGRKIPLWKGKAGGELAMSRPTCLGGAHEIVVGLPPGTPMGFANVRYYIRNPGARGKAPRRLRPGGFRRDYRPPRDAISTGITNGYLTIWTSEKLGDQWLLMKIGDRFERWPASLGGCGA